MNSDLLDRMRSLHRDTGYRKAKSDQINLGIAISGSLLKPGETRTLEEIAAFSGTSKQCIQQIEEKALRSFKRALSRHGITRINLSEYSHRL